MKAGMTEHVLANLVSMSSAVRRGLPVLLLYGGVDPALTRDIEECSSYHVLPPAPDRDTAERVRAILQFRGWADYRVPVRLERFSISLSPPHTDRRPLDPACFGSPFNGNQLIKGGAGVSGEFAKDAGEQHEAASAQSESVLEQFDGFVDRIDDGRAFVTLRSREYGDSLYGHYPAGLLQGKGIEDQDRFVCWTVATGETTRVKIKSVSKGIVTTEQLRAIDEENERILPSDDTIDY
jgi:hypothetical protein